jgi:hypothetical protein
MSTEKEKLEDVFQRLPEDLRAELIAFGESLLRRNGTHMENRGNQSVRDFFGVWDSGDPNSGDNETIERDLVDEYRNPHKTE